MDKCVGSYVCCCAPLLVTTMIMLALISIASWVAQPNTASLVLIGLAVKSRMKSYVCRQNKHRRTRVQARASTHLPLHGMKCPVLPCCSGRHCMPASCGYRYCDDRPCLVTGLRCMRAYMLAMDVSVTCLVVVDANLSVGDDGCHGSHCLSGELAIGGLTCIDSFKHNQAPGRGASRRLAYTLG